MNRKIIIASAATLFAAAAGVVIWLVMLNVPRTDPVAEIYQNGVLLKTLPLSDDGEFSVECENGYNIVKVENGTVRVSEADCPDKVCVHTGAISGGAVPIVCLPHRLEIRVVNGNDSVDAAI